MNTYKCPQCNLTNWISEIVCKRCRLPNPLNQQQSNFVPSVQPTVTAVQNQNSYTQVSQPVVNYMVPPPPPEFNGQSSGFNSYYQNSAHTFFQKPIPPDVQEEFNKAKKNIKNCWIAGIIMSCLGVAGVFLLTLVGKVDGSFMIGAVFTVAIYGGLTFGVSQKSRACAVILLLFYVVDKIATIVMMGGASGIFFGIVFTLYFAYGVQGTYSYRRLREQYPQIL